MWHNFGAWGSRVIPFHCKQVARETWFPKISYDEKFFIRNLWAAAVPRVFIGTVGKRFEPGRKLSWRGPTGHCRGTTSQHLEKKLEKWLLTRIWMAIRKPIITWKYSKQRKKHYLLKTKRIVKKILTKWCPVLTFTLKDWAIHPFFPRQLRHCVCYL